MDTRKTFGSYLRKLREDKGFSQEELAAVAGLHRTYVGSVERGERNVSLDNMLILAEALECKPSYLFKCFD